MYSLQSFSPRSLLLSLLVCTFFVSGILGYGEPDNNGHPNWQERADHVLMNAVRMAPLDYRSKYASDNSPSMSSILTSYPAVAPVYLDSSLGTAALAHSVDMGTHNCFSHASCDGTETFTRIKSYYTCSGTMAENIAAGVADPRKVLNMLVCDSTGSACAADKSSGDGHRKNIMGSGYNAVGIGYGATSGSTYTHYWTQDFGGATCPAQTSPVYGGSHIFQTSGKTKFLANYYQSSNTAPTAARVVIDGTAVSMALDIGTAGKGTYILEQTSGSACRSYYFEFVDASGTYRYPTAGSLVTYGEGQCSTSYTSDASVTSVPTTTPTTAPTSAPTTVPTTKAPTSAPTSAPTTKAPTSAPTSAPTTKAPTSAPTTQTPTSAPTTKVPTAAPTTKAPTSAPTTKAPTSAPTTKAPTSAPTTKAPTAAPTTKAPTAAPTTKAPTTAPTTARPTTTQSPTSPPTTRPPTTQPPTSVPTTVPATDAPGTAAPCVPSEIYSEIYSDGLKNGWTATADNIAGDLSLDCSADFVNHTGICLNMSANGYLKFARTPAIINNYDFFEFIARTDYANVTISVSFEGVNCDNNVVDVTPGWTVYRFSMDTLQAPDVIGNPTTLVIKYEEEEDAPTLHIAEVQFVRIPIYN